MIDIFRIKSKAFIFIWSKEKFLSKKMYDRKISYMKRKKKYKKFEIKVFMNKKKGWGIGLKDLRN